MKAIMSNRAKQILNDPKKRNELIDGLNRLHKSHKDSINTSIGEKIFELKFITAWDEEEKTK